jgi:hypothetical protein
VRNRCQAFAFCSATCACYIPDKSFAPAFATAIDAGKIDFIVLGHLSPKRVDALAAMLMARPAGSPAVVGAPAHVDSP